MAGVALASQAAAQEVVRLPKKVRLAIIGLEGHTSEILDPLNRLPDVELAAVWDRDPKVAHDFSTGKHGRGARAYSDWRELLDHEKLEIVGICGTNGERAEIILECAKRKLP
jgi:predicted dehydrogenase